MDIIQGVAGIKKFSGTVRTANQQSSTRLKSAGNAIKDGARVAKKKATDQTIKVQK